MATEKRYIVTVSSLNIRSGPGTDYDILGSAERGERVLSPNTENWVPIILDDDTTGWVSGKYLKEAPKGEREERPKPKPSEYHADLPIFQNELTEKFGTPDASDRSFTKNLTTIDLSEFADYLIHVRTFNGKPFTSIYGHRLLEGPLKKAISLVCHRGLAKQLKTYDGCFNIRVMSGGGNLSVHSWGLALDFNAQSNPFQPARDFSDMERDFSDDFVKCFAEAGFEWGGLWRSVKDPMHFQLPWNKDWQESSDPLSPKVLEEEKEETAAPSVTHDFSTKDHTIDAIRAECQRQGIGLPAQIAYVLATTDWETGHTFQPVPEGGLEHDDDWRQYHLSKYYPYYGRGYVQLTWEENYSKYANILGIDLVNDPDLALDPQTALFILVHGFKTGAFTGKKITDFINTEEEPDFYNARKCINGLDHAEDIAEIAEKYLNTV